MIFNYRKVDSKTLVSLNNQKNRYSLFFGEGIGSHVISFYFS